MKKIELTKADVLNNYKYGIIKATTPRFVSPLEYYDFAIDGIKPFVANTINLYPSWLESFFGITPLEVANKRLKRKSDFTLLKSFFEKIAAGVGVGLKEFHFALIEVLFLKLLIACLNNPDKNIIIYIVGLDYGSTERFYEKVVEVKNEVAGFKNIVIIVESSESVQDIMFSPL